MRRSISRGSLVCILMVLCAVWVMAATGSIIGTVKDTTGAVVPGVKVTLTNKATNGQLTATANESGRFEFPQLAPASYTLVVEAPGFKKTVADALVEVDQITHVDLALQVGDIVQEVQ